MKCRYMDEMTGGKGIVFAEDSVSNSMTNFTPCSVIFSMKAKKTTWSILTVGHTFGETQSAFELSPEEQDIG